ncbi:uncharacterized protein J4E79_011082 [Alternaria viburni]|uniref:uncharacterized protein n=1 Tax=Alternaria viburni TaxID=566460 RepID=UPI0020C21399|nr:uncharacterized protein J4E79_011082 [Alternaria viburni]KAI4644645.1 hypothetical protein J4E79_011082 [Alternaria viburni]
MPSRFIDIPRTKASKAHSGGSILELPGEIRTMIYVHLFEHHASIRFEYSEDQEKVMSEYTHDEEDIPISCAPVKSDAFTSIRGGINLLFSCRQIYDEAASVLYSNNTFVFGKAPTDCVPDYKRLQSATKDLRQIQSAANWCLGSQMQYVRQVKIDVANGCRKGTCLMHNLWHQSTNITPLVKAMWSPSAAKCHFEFVSSNAWSEDGHSQSHFDIEAANTTLEYLRADTVAFERYSRQVVAVMTAPRTLTPEDKPKGFAYIVLGQSGSHQDTRQYLLLHPGKKTGKLRATMRSPAPHLMGLPYSVRERIGSYVLDHQEAANLMLLMDRMRGFYLGIFPIKSSFDTNMLWW